MKEYLKKNRSFILIGLVVFLSMLPLNVMTPMVYDDYVYTRSFATHEVIKSIWDIFPSMGAHYYVMNGRLILHFIAQLVLFLPKQLFWFSNSMMYVIMGYLVYKHIRGNKEKSPLLFALIFFAMWFYIPAFGETVLWTDGSCNYLWGAVLIFAYLLPFRLYMCDTGVLKKKVWVFLMFVGGVIMGWSNENTSAAAIMGIVLFMIVYKINEKKIPMWSVSGLIGSLIGFVIMITAPANHTRTEYFDSEGTIKQLILRFIDISKRLVEGRYAWLMLLLIFLITYLIFKKKTWKNLLVPAIYTLAFFASMYAMIMSPYFPDRAMFGAVMFLFVAFGLLAEQLPVKRDFAVTMGLMACILMLFGLGYAQTFYDNAVIFVQHNKRVESIEAQIAAGEKDILVDYIPYRGERTAWDDIAPDPTNWTNEAVADYYGVDTVTMQ